ncbi:MAG TPA: hypothetical protein VF175_16675 [Lacipirellula sp.]
MAAKRSFNPFYALLVPAGFVFVVTAFAYGYMAFQAVNLARAEAGRQAGHPLFQWLRANGDMTMLVELAVLAVLTVGAIGTDRFWDKSEREQVEFDRLSRGN